MIERYTRPEMGKIWTPENRYQAWLRVELAVCEAWNRVGEISDADMETLLIFLTLGNLKKKIASSR